MLDSLLSVGETIWGILFLGLWMCLGFVHLMSLRDGYILGVTAGPRAINRSKQPIKFWVTWIFLAWPFVIFPLIAVVGFTLLLIEK